MFVVVTHATDSSLRKVSDMTSNFSLPTSQRTKQQTAAADPSWDFLPLSLVRLSAETVSLSFSSSCLPHTHTFWIDDTGSSHLINIFNVELLLDAFPQYVCYEDEDHHDLGDLKIEIYITHRELKQVYCAILEQFYCNWSFKKIYHHINKEFL